MTIYLAPLRDRLPRRLGSCSHLRPSRRATSHAHRTLRPFRRLLQGGLPFSLHSRRSGLGHCCSHPPKRVPIWTVRTRDRPCPRFRVAPRSMQLGLSSASRRRQRPSCARRPCSTLFAAHRLQPKLRLLLRPSVPGQGFEPRYADPKSAVLPLDDPGPTTHLQLYRKFGAESKAHYSM
jgi:hypothetical protein